MTLLDDFMLRALMAGLGVGIAAAPLGCFVVWRRMAYFGDATAHATVLGVALSLALSLPVLTGALAVALLVALVIATLSDRGLAADTLLGVAAHGTLAVGLVAASFVSGVRVDLMAYLFGDILAVGRADLLAIWSGAAAVLLFLWWRWSALLTATLGDDLAYAAGLNPRREGLGLTLALAVVVAVGIKIVGALLIAAMLVIPAAAARPLARTPEAMAAAAAALAALAVLAGLAASLAWDTPAGPSIVSAAVASFAVTSTLAAMLRGRHRRG